MRTVLEHRGLFTWRGGLGILLVTRCSLGHSALQTQRLAYYVVCNIKCSKVSYINSSREVKTTNISEH